MAFVASPCLFKDQEEKAMLKELCEKKESRKVIIFFLSAYVMPWILFPWIKSEEVSGVWAQWVMTLPAAGIIWGKWYVEGTRKDFFQKVFIVGSLCYAVYAVFCVAGVVPRQYIETGADIVIIPFSVLLFFYCILFSNEKLYPFKNRKKMIIIVLSAMGYSILMGVIGDSAFHIGKQLLFEMGSVFNVLVLSGLCFMGEEYAWRGHLQKKLQGYLGKRKGVILLGILWEIWHIPLWFGYFHFEQMSGGLVVVIILRFVNVIGLAIFLGWVYMKTENVWLCALLHGMNNQNNMLGTTVEILPGIPIGAIIQPIILWTFLFSKVYKKEISAKEE